MMKNRIEAKLRKTFLPEFLEVTDDSHLHIGHANSRPGGETHFSVKIVSSVFCNLNRIQRHQKVYACLEEELKNGLHALCLTTLCPQEKEASTALE